MLIAQQLLSAQLFESAMLICFGVSWPVAIFKTLRVKRVEGKSLYFLGLVFAGYIAGIVSKLIRAHQTGHLEWVTSLYALNALLVGVDAWLYLRYRTKNGNAPKG